MKLNVKLILFGTPWVIDRLPQIEEFWGDKVLFDWTFVHAGVGAAEMMSWGTGSVLSTDVVNRWADDRFDLTIFSAPRFSPCLDYKGNKLPGPTYQGMYLPDRSVIQVFANEFHDDTFAPLDNDANAQVRLGDTFTVFMNHELSHHFYQSVLKEPDMTHTYFGKARPEMARDFIVSKL